MGDQGNVRPAMRPWKVVGAWAFALAGCMRPAPGTPDAGPVAVAIDAGPVVPWALDLVLELEDGGTERHALLGLETPVATPARQLRVDSNRALHNVRIRVMDESDRALASDDVPEESPGALHYHIALRAPLEPGHRYAVLVDAQSGATFDDGTGKEIPEQRLEFQTGGERARPKPPPPRKKRRH
ncbi:MAG TPA: hypothetical protein VMH40_11605 [Myxococcaceae bacterium]|nr:hypothetical protein [Myxococcaceae bacterium]